MAVGVPGERRGARRGALRESWEGRGLSSLCITSEWALPCLCWGQWGGEMGPGQGTDADTESWQAKFS